MSVIVVILLGAVVYGVVLSLAILIVVVRVALLVIVDIFLLLLLSLVVVLLLLAVVAIVLLVVVVILLLLLLLVLILILLLLIVTSLIVTSLVVATSCSSLGPAVVLLVVLLLGGCSFRRKYFACGLLAYAIHGFSLHEHLVEAFFLFCRLRVGLRRLLLGCGCIVSWQVGKLIVGVSRSLVLLRRWLIGLHFLIGVVIVHFCGQAARLLFGLLSRADNGRRDVFHPAVPVPLDKLGHIVGLRVRVLQVKIGRLSRALVRVPIRWDPPGISAGI